MPLKLLRHEPNCRALLCGDPRCAIHLAPWPPEPLHSSNVSCPLGPALSIFDFAHQGSTLHAHKPMASSEATLSNMPLCLCSCPESKTDGSQFVSIQAAGAGGPLSRGRHGWRTWGRPDGVSARTLHRGAHGRRPSPARSRPRTRNR